MKYLIVRNAYQRLRARLRGERIALERGHLAAVSFLPVDLRCIDRYYYCKASGGRAVQTTISTKYQIVIPSEVRKRLRLKPRQKLTVLEKGGVLYLIPEGPLTDLRGVAPMVPAEGFRDKEDRY